MPTSGYEWGGDRRTGTRRGRTAGVLFATTLGCALSAASVLANPAIRPGSPARANTAPASENAAATQAYLIATVSFEEAELADLPKSVAATEEAAARISGECPGVLAGAPPAEREPGIGGVVGLGPPMPPGARPMGERTRQSRQREDLQQELSIALAAARMQPNREAAGALLAALTPLKWSNPKITFLVHLILTEAREELDVAVPAVCADMKTWVASGYRTLSPASKEFASRSEALLKLAFEAFAVYSQARVQPFPKILAPYESASDEALAVRSEALAAELRKANDTQSGTLEQLERTIGLPAPKVPKVKRPTRKPVMIGRGKTAAGGRYVATVEPRLRSLGCVNVTITEPSSPRLGALLEVLSGEGTGRCLSRSHIRPEQSVHCNSGLLTVEADLLPAARSVRLLLSDSHTITSPAIRVPARLGGPAGLYYQVVRGPSPIPVSLTEFDAQGRTLVVLKLPAVVECTKHPVKYFPGGIATLAHESLPQGPSFTIRGERYRKLGAVHFELKLKVSNEEQLFGPGGGSSVPASVEEEARVGADTSLRDRRAFQPKASSGCEPQPYVIIYGLLKASHDTVLARVAGTLVPLHKVAIPARLHAGGTLAYGAFSPIPTELLIRNASGRTVARQDLGEAAKAETETCEGEAE
jgi:hypothetical protein